MLHKNNLYNDSSNGKPFDWKEAKEEILRRLNIADEYRALGVVTIGRPTVKGWLSCRAVDREDRHPSAGINVRTGRYHDFSTGADDSLWDFAAKHSGFRNWFDALRHFAQKVGVEFPGRRVRSAQQNPAGGPCEKRADDLPDAEILRRLGIYDVERIDNQTFRYHYSNPNAKWGPGEQPYRTWKWNRLSKYPSLIQAFGPIVLTLVRDDENDDRDDPQKFSIWRVREALGRTAGFPLAKKK